jgi:hypothetical protein
LQQACRQIRVFSLLQKKLSSRKVSSRLIHRTLNKTDIPREVLGFSKAQVESKLKESYTAYYKVKKDHIAKRQSYLEELASVFAEQQDLGRANMLRQLKERENQRSVARKIRYLQGKFSKGSTTMVTVDTPEGLQDITDKELVEQAIMESNSAKYQQSHHRPFYKDPLRREFGFKGLTPQSSAVLAGVHDSNEDIPEAEKQLLAALMMPMKVKEQGPQSMDIPLQNYRSFWRKAKESISSYPGAISFSTMKAGALSELISCIECNLTRIL